MTTIPLSININFNQIIDVVKKLSPQEKQLLNDAIWDDEMLVPTEHQILVADRVKKSKQNSNRMLDWNKVSANL